MRQLTLNDVEQLTIQQVRKLFPKAIKALDDIVPYKADPIGCDVWYTGRDGRLRFANTLDGLCDVWTGADWEEDGGPDDITVEN